MGDGPRGSDIETIASADRIEPTVASGPAGEATLAAVDPAHYAVEGELAHGGMGRILVARDRRLGRVVALKELLTEAGPGAPGRFVREALVTARLQHPAIVPVYEAGRWPDGRPFYAMKLVGGRSLEALFRSAPGLAARLGMLPHLIAVAEAVAYAHSQRVVHRDLKPANVLVGPFGETVVVDWGLAREMQASGAGEEAEPERPPVAAAGQTITGTVLGTPSYMPPEQARGLPADERADVYALGAMLYFLLAGVPPHEGRSAEDALMAAAEGSIVPVERREPGAPSDLVAIVHKAMAASPGDRYPSAQELAADLQRFQTGQLVSVHHYSTRELLRRFARRHRTPLAVAAVLSTALVLAVAAGFVGVRRQARLAEAERDRARLAAEKAERVNAFVVGMLSSADPRVSGRHVEVASVLDAASARVEDELGDQPEVKAAVLATLGTTYQGLGLYAPARERLQAALAASRAAFGAEHVEGARALDRLGGAFEDEGDQAEAERLYREAQVMLQRVGLQDSSDMAQVQGDLARVLRWLGRTAEAEALYRDSLAILRRREGPGSATVAATLNNLGVLFGQRGDWAGAEPLHREALEIVRTVHGPEHPDVAAGLNTLGGVLEAKGDLGAAERLYRESLQMRVRLLGAEHPDVARSRYTLAGLLRVKGDREGALQECRQVLALRGSVLPDAHPMVAATQQIMGLALVDLRRAREAEPILRESLALRSQALPAGHWLIASSESALGACLTAQRRYGEAETLLLRAHAALSEARGDGEPTRDARRRIEALYEAWGRPEQAAAWRVRKP